MPGDLVDPIRWYEIGVYSTQSEAEIDASYLRSEGVTTNVVPFSDAPGQQRQSRLFVDSSQENRARWLLKIPPVGEAELEYLATGILPKPKVSE